MLVNHQQLSQTLEKTKMMISSQEFEQANEQITQLQQLMTALFTSADFDKTIFLHPSEGNDFVLKNYPKEDILKVAGKLWVKNPYKLKFPTIKDDKNLTSNTKISSSLVPRGKYFVMGDNRDYSKDSRDFGMIEGKEVFKPLLIVGNEQFPKRKGIEIKDTPNAP